MADAGIQTEDSKGIELKQPEPERGKKSVLGRFVAARQRVRDRVTGLTGRLRGLQEIAPEAVGGEVKEADALLTDLGDLEATKATELGAQASPEDRESEKEQEPMRLQDMAIYHHLQATVFQELDQRNAWRNERSGPSYMDAVALEDFIRGADVRGPLAIAYGLDINQLQDGIWKGRSVSFEDSFLIDRALAEFIGNDAHIPKPIQYKRSLRGKAEPVLDAQTWLTALNEGNWPVAMQRETHDGTEWFPFYHDATETHRAIMQFAPRSTQRLISEVAALDLKRINDKRDPVSLPGDEDWQSLYGYKDGEDRLPNISGIQLLDELSDESLWVLGVEDLLTAPVGQLPEKFNEIESRLKIDTAPVRKLAAEPLLNAQISLLNYKSREAQGRNLTDDEVRNAAHDYMRELHTHLQTIRGCD